MSSAGYFFNRRGELLDEIEADFRCTYTINGVDPCVFSFPTRDLKHAESVFEFGNYLVVKKGRGLPDWVGKLEPRRSWDPHVTQHSAVSPLNIFNQRNGQHLPIRTITAPAGYIFKEFIEEANLVEDTLIRPNDLFYGDRHFSTFISPHLLLMKSLERLFRQSTNECEFVPQIENNKLLILANWRSRLGVTIDHGLHERNCDPDESPLTEEGPIFNTILGIGQERSDETRSYHWARNQESVDRFGARINILEVQSDDESAVIVMTEAELLRLAWPRKVYKATIAPDAYEVAKLGNIMKFDFPKVGFGGTQTTVRLTGMIHDDKDEGVIATLKEYV